MRSIILSLCIITCTFAAGGDENHRRHKKTSSISLRKVSKNRHILAIDEEEDSGCGCSGSRQRSKWSRNCRPCSLSDAREPGYATNSQDNSEPNYSVITSSGQVMDSFSNGDTSRLSTSDGTETSNSDTAGNVIPGTDDVVVDDDDSAVSAAAEWTILQNGTNITRPLPGDPNPREVPADFVPVTTGGAIAPTPITDQTLLTVYKGNDASDRTGPMEFEDVFSDFHLGWRLWPTTKIQFRFDSGVSNCVQTIFNIAVSVVNEHSCVVVEELPVAPRVEDSIDSPILHITEFNPDDDDPSPNRPGCSASLGYMDQVGSNEIHFAPGCLTTGTAIHLLLHALGMFHEHQRPDRDNFVNVVTTNMDVTRLGASSSSVKMNAVFGKVDPATPSPWVTAVMNRSYDYDSIMHNGPCHYSVSQEFGGAVGGCALQPTLLGSPQSGMNYTGKPADIGNRLTMSLGDKITLNKMYQCPVPLGGFTVAPDPADVASVEAAQCTILDAADFAWSERANTMISSASANSRPSSTNIKLSSETSTGNNEQSTFKDYLRDAAKKTVLIILCCVLGGILLIAAVGFFWWFKKRKSASRDAVLQSGDSDDITRALREQGNGAGTDDEVIDEIIEKGVPSNQPPATAAR